MTTPRILYLVSSLLVVAALVVGCGGKKSTSTTAPAGTTPAAAQSQPTTAPAGSGATQATATRPAGGGAAVDSELASFASNFKKVKTFKATISLDVAGQGTLQGTLEVSLPDNRVHMTTPQFEVISIGTDSYLKIGATWSKSTSPLGNAFDVNQFGGLVTAAETGQGYTKGGTDTVNGKRCQLYTQVAGGATTEICVADGLPVRVVTNAGGGKTTLIFTDYDKGVDIKAPI